MIKQKRGVSGVVIMILLVLLALAAVAIVWGFVQSYIRGSTGGISSKAACIEADLIPVSCNLNGTSAIVSYKLNSGDVSGVKVVLNLDDGSSVVVDGSEINELETKVTNVENVENAESATVAAVVSVDGVENTCEAYLNDVTCA